MKTNLALRWQTAVLALPLLFVSPEPGLAQLNPPLSLGPPPCSLDNPQFNENVDAGKCSTSDILNGLATLPAPNSKPSPEVQVTVESGQARQNPPTETALPTNRPRSPSAVTTAPAVVPPKTSAQAQLPQPLPQPPQVAVVPQAETRGGENAQPERDNILLVLFILLGVSVFTLAALFLLPVLGADKQSDQ